MNLELLCVNLNRKVGFGLTHRKSVFGFCFDITKLLYADTTLVVKAGNSKHCTMWIQEWNLENDAPKR